MRIGPVDQQNDLWTQYIRMVVPHDRTTDVLQGQSLPATVAPWGGVITDILVAFSSVAIVLAVVWMIWQTISAVVSAAWSGEAISREWHSIWGPIRIVLGLTLIMPVANGNNLAQLFVIQTSLWSGQVANTIYQVTLRAMSQPATQASLVHSDARLATMVRTIALVDLCSRSAAHVQNVERTQGRRILSGSIGQALAANVAREAPMGAGAGQRNDGVRVDGNIVCPRMVAPLIEPTTRNAWFTSVGMSGDDYARIRQIWASALDSMAADFRPIGERLFAGTLGTGGQNTGAEAFDPVERFRQWETESIARWRRASEEAVNVVRNAWHENRARQQMESRGWLNAPALIWQRVGIMRDAWAIANTLPEVQNLQPFVAALNDPVQQSRYRTFQQMVAVLDTDLLDGRPAVAQGAGGQDAERSSGNQSLDMMRGLAQGMGFLPSIDITQGSPIMQVADWGFWMIELGSVVWVGSASAGIFSGVTDSIASVAGRAGVSAAPIVEILSRGISALASFGMFLGGVMVLIGVLHAYVLPVLPMIIFVIFALGCLVLLVEALIAAPIWALGHIKLAGQGVVDNTQLPGYQILLGLFIRIPIAVIAFVFSLLVTDVSLHGVAQIVTPGFGGHVSSLGPIGLIVFLLVLGFISWQVCIRSFSMINELPDKVMRWIHIQSPAQGDDGQRAMTGIVVAGMQRAGAATTAATGVLSSPARRAISGPAPGVASKLPRQR